GGLGNLPPLPVTSDRPDLSLGSQTAGQRDAIIASPGVKVNRSGRGRKRDGSSQYVVPPPAPLVITELPVDQTVQSTSKLSSLLQQMVQNPQEDRQSPVQQNSVQQHSVQQNSVQQH